MSFLLTDGRGVAFDDDDDDDAVVAATTTMASTSTSTSTTTATDRAPTRRSRHHARTYTPHTESLVGLFARRVSDYGSFVPLPRAGTAVDVVDVEVHGGGDLNCMEVNGLLDYSHIDDGDDDGGEDEDEEDSGNERTRSSWGFTRTSSRGGGQKIPPPSSHPSLDKVLARHIPALLGSFLFPLYQLVFCFAEASAITRPSRLSSGLRSSLLSPMALTACVGSLFSGPMLIAVLGGSRDYPALYPCLDMFMAPFLAQIAVDVDEALVHMRPPQGGGGGGGDAEYDDDDAAAFLATFAALNALGMLLVGLLCALAGRVRLANLAGFLPFPVLCGFFSSVGLSIWLSAFKVDAGTTVGRALADGTIVEKLGRHVPSVVAGAGMYLLGPRGPHYHLGGLASTIAAAYLAMLATGTSLEEARAMGFFWGPDEVMTPPGAERPFAGFGPPAPFGLWSAEARGAVCWPAFRNGLHGVVAMSVIYLLRCSLNAAVMAKLAKVRRKPYAGEALRRSSTIIPGGGGRRDSTFSTNSAADQAMQMKSKPKDLMAWYANSFFSIALSGGFAVLPALGLGGVFWKIGAESRLPQYGGYLILLTCYVNDFGLCTYVPKCTFSSLLVMAALDLTHTWFVRSYAKSPKEWAVIPLIVGTSLAYGSLPSIGIGLCASTLIFIASFQQAGVVKFVATGLTVRSTIERNCEDNRWLDEHAELIQVLVLQNYLFFGNASTCLSYFESMFDDEDRDLNLPTPKYVILDTSIITGIDASAVDVLADIASLCKENRCKLILAGIPRIIGPSLATGGVKPSASNKHLSIESDLEAALGKAEDELLKYIGHKEEQSIEAGKRLRHIRRVSMVDHGVRHALREIDKQHDLQMSSRLQELEMYTKPVELDTDVAFCSRPGLYFVESGLIKCEHDSSLTVRRTGGSTRTFVGLGGTAAHDKNFRLARIGPGWVIGSLSGSLGRDNQGTYTAVTPCRVHHLTLETIQELESDKPVLIMHLYKLISRLTARRQEMTIGQLATLRSIMSATAQTKPK